MNISISKTFFYFENIIYKYDYIFLYIFLALTFYTFIFSHALYRTLAKLFYAALIALFIRKKIKIAGVIDPISCLIACFFIIAVASNLHNQQPISESFQIVRWIFPYLLAKLLIRYDKMTPERLAYSFCIAVMILAAVGFIGDVFSLDTLFGKKIFEYRRFAFTMDGSNRAGFYLSTSIFVMMGLMVTRKKISFRKDVFLLYLPTALMLYSLILTGEKKSILLLPFFAVTTVLLSKKYKILFLISVIGASVLYSIDIPSRLHISSLSRESSTVSSRLNAWKISYRLIEQKPFFGHGFGSFMKESGDYFMNNKTKFSFNNYKPLYCAHNINLNTLAETGILGVIILNGIFFISILMAFKTGNSSDFVFYIGLTIMFIYLELQFGNFIKSFQRTNYTFLLLGICAGIYSKTNRNATLPPVPGKLSFLLRFS